MQDGTGTTTYAYDAASRTTGKTDPGALSQTYAYDAAGQRTRTTKPYDPARRASLMCGRLQAQKLLSTLATLLVSLIACAPEHGGAPDPPALANLGDPLRQSQIAAKATKLLEEAQEGPTFVPPIALMGFPLRGVEFERPARGGDADRIGPWCMLLEYGPPERPAAILLLIAQPPVDQARTNPSYTNIDILRSQCAFKSARDLLNLRGLTEDIRIQYSTKRIGLYDMGLIFRTPPVKLDSLESGFDELLLYNRTKAALGRIAQQPHGLKRSETTGSGRTTLIWDGGDYLQGRS